MVLCTAYNFGRKFRFHQEQGSTVGVNITFQRLSNANKLCSLKIKLLFSSLRRNLDDVGARRREQTLRSSRNLPAERNVLERDLFDRGFGVDSKMSVSLENVYTSFVIARVLQNSMEPFLNQN